MAALDLEVGLVGAARSLAATTTCSVASDREGNHLKCFDVFHLIHGSSKGQNLALIVFIMPNSLGSGLIMIGSGWVGYT